MTRNLGALVASAFAFAFLLYACTSGEVVQGPGSGTGNTTGSAGSTGAGNTTGRGGSTGAGNQVGSGGSTGAGNQVGSGGSTGAGNSVGSGGSTGAGNATGRGGTTGAGNAVGSAGSTGAGNSVGSAGSTGAGNSVGSAGSTGAGGSTATCPPSFNVASNGFVQMPVTGGCFSGYPYTYADTFGTTVMPTPMTAFTTNMLKLTGSIVANNPPNYAYAGIGFSVGQTAAGEQPPPLIAPKGNGLVFNVTNTTSGTGLAFRAQVTNGTTTWCKTVTGFPATVMYSELTVNCYAAGGAMYMKEPIKGIEVNIAGGTAAGTINLQINSITEN